MAKKPTEIQFAQRYNSILKIFISIIHGEVLKEFDSEADGAWEGLADGTMMNRKYSGYPPAHPILKRTGELRNSIKVYIDYAVNEIVIESNSIYAETHQEGGYEPNGGAEIPARPFLDAPSSCEIGGDKYIKYFERPLVNLFKKI